MTPTAPAAVTVAEAARRLTVCERTIRRAADEGRLKAVRIGRAVRITAASIEALLAGEPAAGEDRRAGG